jgi:cyanate permease
MVELLKLLLEICRFKKAPQDLPYSVGLLKILIGIDLVVSFVMINFELTTLTALFEAIVGVLLILLSGWITVYFSGKRQRFCQTASALIGVDALIGFYAIPALATMATGNNSALVFWVMFGLMIWHWAVTGHIIRHAIDKSLAFGLGVAFLYIVASYKVIAFLFPEVSGAN